MDKIIEYIGKRRNTAPTKYRFERKYFLNEDTAHILSQRLSYVLQPDTHGIKGKYHISSLYFDDVYNTSFYEKQNGILERDKFRVRFYNNSLDVLHLELKHKNGEMIYKQRASITLEQFDMMRKGDYSFMRHETKPVFEKFYTAHLLKQKRPVITVNYSRQAYTYSAGNVRITFDSDLSASTLVGDHSFSVLTNKNMILEVKYDHFLPTVVSELLTGVPFTQQLAISKFIMARLAIKKGV